MKELCPECSKAWTAWLDYRLPPAPIQLCTPGRTRVRDVDDFRTARYEQWRDTILSQQALIEQLCRVGRCVTKREENP